MATLNDLKKSISEMSEDEIFESLKELRRLRRAPVKIKAKAKTKKAKKPIDMDELLSKMSPEQLTNLMNKMGGS